MVNYKTRKAANPVAGCLMMVLILLLAGCGGGNGGGGNGGGVVLPPAVYVNNSPLNAPATVAAWSVNATGVLTPMAGSPFATGMNGGGFAGDSDSIQIHEATRRLFVSGDNAIAVFDIDPITGALTPVPGSPFGAGTGLQVYGVAVTGDGAYVYGANMNDAGAIQNTSFISIFEVQPNGSLVAHATSPRDTGVSSRADLAMLTPDDAYLYVNTEDGEFLGYAVGSDGALTQLSGSPYLVDPMAKTYGGRVHPDGRALYLPETTLNPEGVLVYAINAATGLPSLDPDSPHAANNASGVTFANDGNRLYTAQFNGNVVYAFDVAADGDLTALSTSPYMLNTTSAAGIVISADGTRFVVVDFQNDQLGVYDVAPDGALTEAGGSPYSNTPASNGTAVVLTF